MKLLLALIALGVFLLVGLRVTSMSEKPGRIPTWIANLALGAIGMVCTALTLVVLFELLHTF